MSALNCLWKCEEKVLFFCGTCAVNLEHGGHGSACTLGRFPLSSEEVALGEQSVQQQRQQKGSGPLNQQHLPAYPERLGLPVGSDESEPARTTSGKVLF